jgi:hypothetical protein
MDDDEFTHYTKPACCINKNLKRLMRLPELCFNFQKWTVVICQKKAYIVTFTLFLKNSIVQFCINICFENVLTDFLLFCGAEFGGSITMAIWPSGSWSGSINSELRIWILFRSGSKNLKKLKKLIIWSFLTTYYLFDKIFFSLGIKMSR